MTCCSHRADISHVLDESSILEAHHVDAAAAAASEELDADPQVPEDVGAGDMEVRFCSVILIKLLS